MSAQPRLNYQALAPKATKALAQLSYAAGAGIDVPAAVTAR